MSYAEELRKLAAVEHDLMAVCLDPHAMDGEVFDNRLEPLLVQLYRAHQVLCRASARPAGADSPRPT
jgi:hypothetical protein